MPTTRSKSFTSRALETSSRLLQLPNGRPTSMLDSPTLARVERAQMRLEQQQMTTTATGSLQQPQHLSHLQNGLSPLGSSATTLLRPDGTDKPSLLSGRISLLASLTGPIKRGLLMQQRDRLFSRWKERYFVLTRDYLHCFKRASGSGSDRASDMGQFIFKVKLVDVEKVEWLNRRSYSAISLCLGREGRVLLRSSEGLEDWFEFLEECTRISKDRRHALKIAQGPRSRASLAAPLTHATLQTNHFGLGGDYNSALDDWLMANCGAAPTGLRGHQMNIANGHPSGFGIPNARLFSDSVPDLSAALNHENRGQHQHMNGFATDRASAAKKHDMHETKENRIASTIDHEDAVDGNDDEEEVVQLRNPQKLFGHHLENNTESDSDWRYRRPEPPKAMRHSVQPLMPTSTHDNRKYILSGKSAIADLDSSGHDSGLDTLPSTHRPSSCRDVLTTKQRQYTFSLLPDSPDVSPRTTTVLNQTTNHITIQKHVLHIHQEKSLCNAIKSA